MTFTQVPLVIFAEAERSRTILQIIETEGLHLRTGAIGRDEFRGDPGLTNGARGATRNKCIASSNK